MQILPNERVKMSHKVVLLGDSRVGKTSMITRQMLGYQPPVLGPTVGSQTAEVRVTIDTKDITLEIWDTAGQEIYRSIVPIYLRGARAVILVYDVTDPYSFASLVHWQEALRDTVPPGTPLYVVANKIDLAGQIAVSEPQAKQFAATHQAQFFRVSAITGQGLDILFETIAKRMTDGPEVLSAPRSFQLTPQKATAPCPC
jgi:small GTP-binding protein